ncbi:MAG: heme A synthase [Solirubrobacterales bacterium]|nr:heme A synthase [Solirubrobacterales bacterium]
MSVLQRRLAAVRARWTVPPRWHEVAAWAALVLLTLIVVSGAAVRLTGSGLGCPDWPRCNGTSLTPSQGHAYIEFGNRMVTTPVAIASLACLVLALLRAPLRRDLVWLGFGLSAGVAAQAILGGITVLTGLNPWTVAAHFLLSMVTLVLATTNVWRVVQDRRGAPATPERDPRLVLPVRALAVFGGAVVVLGTLVTASGPYAGGEGTGDVVQRVRLFGSDGFNTGVMVHARAAAVFGALAVALWFWARARHAGRQLQLPLTMVCLVVALAGLIGNIQYHQRDDYPEWLVWAHVSVATLLWNALCWSVLAAGRPAREPRTAEEAPTVAATREPTAV